MNTNEVSIEDIINDISSMYYCNPIDEYQLLLLNVAHDNNIDILYDITGFILGTTSNIRKIQDIVGATTSNEYSIDDITIIYNKEKPNKYSIPLLRVSPAYIDNNYQICTSEYRINNIRCNYEYTYDKELPLPYNEAFKQAIEEK